MKDNIKRISKAAITYPVFGLISIWVGYFFASRPSGLNVHSEEVLISGFILLIITLILPLILFIRSLQILNALSILAKPNLKTYSIFLTCALGLSLIVIAVYIWITIK